MKPYQVNLQDGSEPKTHIAEDVANQATKEDLILSNDPTAVVTWYKWFVCYMNKSHVFTRYIDRNGEAKFKCVRCGVQKV